MAKKTTDYKQFKIIRGNRAIDRNHLKKLVASIAEDNLLRYNPIIVNDKLEIIDGQHRLLAAQQLEVPIWWEKVKGGSIDDVQTLNSTVRGWFSEDYMKSYVDQGKTTYKKLKKFCKDYDLPVTTALSILTQDDHIRRGAMADFKAGRLKITEKQFREGRQMVMKLQKISNYTVPNLWKVREFIKALYTTLEVVKFDDLIEKLEQSGIKLDRQFGVKRYLHQFEEVLSYKRKVRVTLY